MAARPAFFAALGAVVIGTVAFTAIAADRHAGDQRDTRAVRTAVQRVELPAGSVPSRECHGDGVVACAVMRDSTVAIVSPTLVAALEQAAGRKATTDCIRVANGAATGQQTCLIAARWGHHAVIASADPHVFNDHGKPAVAGVLITLSVG